MIIKLISLNLAGYQDWERRQADIVSYLNTEKPDILLLQEVKFDPGMSSLSQSTLLNRLLETPYAYEDTSVTRYHKPHKDDAYREGLAVLSNFPIVKSESLVLIKNDADAHTRFVQSIDLKIGDTEFKVSNIHFSNNQYSGDQFAELLTILEQRGEKRVLCGDFNIFELEQYESLYSPSYVASTEFKRYVSFPAGNLTLDYMLLPREYKYESLEVIPGLSDHNGLEFILNI